MAATPTATATRVTPSPTGGPSVTPLFGQSNPTAGVQPTLTRVLNPNAPRIEYFAADVETVSPGGEVTLFWSTRNVEQAVIYRLDQNNQRTLVYNIAPDGNQRITVGQRERVSLSFMIVVGEGEQQLTETLMITILCPILWFFQPAPEECPTTDPQTSNIIEQSFERGRMIYIEQTNQVYALFNDGQAPAWVSFANQYDPAIHPQRDESFELSLAGTGLVQPVGRLGYVWRGSDVVRTRLGVGTAPETAYDGFIQRAPTSATNTNESLFLTSSGGVILQLLPNGTSWQIITPS
ncbi:MAG: hypothetical protein MUF87_07365 [Anaerolineae bacterium]|nr:hypothetical protein [Anaerolineae bacterium]